MNKKSVILSKVLNSFVGLLLIFQSFAPGLLYAQETSAPSPQSSPSETLEPSPSIEPTTIPESSPSPSVLPGSSPEVTPSSGPSSEPKPTDQAENNSSPEPTVGQPNAPPSENPSPSQTPEPSPSVTVEQPAQGNLSATILENTDAESLELDLSTQSDITSASLTTDKGDYAPTDTVVVAGSDFAANTEYTLIISSSDDPAVNFQTQVTTNDKGTFIYSYQLDGNYRPNYKVEVKDSSGAVIASTIFTDSLPSGCTNDSGGLNDLPGANQQKDLTKMCADYTNIPVSVDVTWNWDNSRFTGDNTGDACALFDTDSDGKANYAVCVQVGGDPGAYVTKFVYSCDDSSATNCLGNATISPVVTTCTANVQATDPFSGGAGYPNDTVASCTINLSDVGGSLATLTDVCSYPSASTPSNASDCILFRAHAGKLTLTKVLSPNTDPGLFNLQIDGVTATGGADVGDGGTTLTADASEGSHTIGETAGTNTSLSNYTSSVVCKDGHGTGNVVTTTGTNPWTLNVADGSDVLCTITNTRINNGSITIVKDAQPNNAQDFTFTTTGSGLSGFSLDDDSDGTLSNTKVFSDLAAGTYSVTEEAVTDWTQSSATCSDGSPVTAIDLAAGESVTCTFINIRDTGTLRIIKDVVSDNGGTKLASDFTLHVKQGSTDVIGSPAAGSATGTVYTLNTGSYTVSENTPPTGYIQTGFSGDCDSSGNVTVVAGVEKTCTITNDDVQPKLTVTKVVVNDNGGTKEVSDFPLLVDTTSVTSGVQNGFNAGTYTVSETNPGGYAGTITGDCASNGSITLAAGDVKSCTITNNDQAAHIIVIKNVTNNDNGTKAPSDFTMHINGTSVGVGVSFPGATGIGTNTTVNAGDYIASEDSVAGYSGSMSGDCSGSIANGETKTCTVTNDDQSANLIVIKHVVNDNGGTAAASTFTMHINGTSVGTGVSFPGAESPGINTTVKAGSFTVIEDSEDGYSSSTSGDCSGSIDNGETKTCTITNNDIAPTLKLVKSVTNNNGGNATAGNWTLTASGPTGFSGPGPSVSSDSSFKVGTYNLSESGGPSGYSASSWSCQGGSQNGNQITLDLGQSATCTITNDDEAGTLIVRKVVRNDNGGTLNEEDFSFKVNNGSAVPFETDGQNDLTVDADIYTITEPSVDGYDTTYDNCSNVVISNGGTQECTITNDDQPAHLIVIKHVENNDGGTALASDFTMTINGVVVQSGGSSFSGEDAPGTDRVVEPGTYSVTEEGSPGYSSSFSSGCSGTIDLGQTKICTVTNSDIKPTLQVIKVVVNDNGGGAEIGDFPLKVDNATVTSGDMNSFNAGTYVVSETNQPGYTATFSGDCDENGNVALQVGDDLRTCTITNDDVAPTLTLIKNLPNNNGGTATQDDFNVYINDEEAEWGQNTVNAGDLTVSEDILDGYDPSVWGGDCDEDGNITLLPGDNKTCTITNDDQPGTLIVKKVVVNDSGGTKNAEDFSFSVNEASPAAFEIDGQNDLTVDAGTYSVTEPEVSGYSTSYDNCLGIQIPNGGSATCTITNDDIAPVLTLVKTVINDNGGTATQDDFPVYINGQASSWGAHILSAGSYTVSEATASGYTPSSWGNDCAANGTVTLNAGDNKTCGITNDDQPGKISGKKFNDLNGDHTKDTGEPGLEGWTITLDKENDINPPACIGGTVIGELCIKITNSFGNYAFNGLEPGIYIVSEVLQPGWAQTRPDAIYGGQGHQANGTYLLTIGSGTEIDGRDFGNWGALFITACKFEDHNGKEEGGELSEVNNWDFTLNGQTTQNTGEGNCATFENLTPDEYSVSENPLPNGWFVADDSQGTRIVVLTNESQTVNFHNFRQGEISGTKWDDKDGNGEQDCEDDSDGVCELGLEEWIIFLDRNENGVLDEGEDFEETDEDGFYSFTDLDPGTYRICEEPQTQNGWSQTFPDNPELNNCHSVSVFSGGHEEDINFGNQGQGTITVHKNVDNNGDGQVDEENVTNWTWDINQEGDFATGDNSQGVAAGSYTISEDQKESYHVSALECNNNGSYDPSESIGVTVDAGQSLICTFTNTRDTGSVTILKDLDNNGDGDTKDEGETGVTDWTWDITDDDQNIPTGQTKILPTGTYTISEDQKDGYKLLGWTCSNEQRGATNFITLDISSGSETTCTFTNQISPPVLTLTKINNQSGIDVSAGANVLYTLTVALTGSPLSSVSLTDLPPAGFVYRTGSWTAVSSVRGDLKPGTTGEPTYASPGTWNLGDMASGEVVTLTYIADIENSQDPGLYKDLAWSKGTGASGAVLANQSSGFFVGTEVNVVKNISDSTGVEVIKKEQGEVLGASIALPATGANASWLIFAAFLLVGGAGMVFKGVSLRRKYE